MATNQFRAQSGTARFEVETAYSLLLPWDAPPPGGWPLVVCLHGMGMTADQFTMVLNGALIQRAAWLFPQAVYPYEIRREGQMRIGHAWYLYDGREEPFRTTLRRSEEYLLSLIDSVAATNGIDPENVVLLGYSQGAYLAYFAAIRNSARFRGLIAIGGRMKEEFVSDELPEARRLPILIVHGESDTSVPVSRARVTHDTLARHGFPVEMKTFPFGHEIRAAGVQAIREWLQQQLVDGEP